MPSMLVFDQYFQKIKCRLEPGMIGTQNVKRQEQPLLSIFPIPKRFCQVDDLMREDHLILFHISALSLSMAIGWAIAFSVLVEILPVVILTLTLTI